LIGCKIDSKTVNLIINERQNEINNGMQHRIIPHSRFASIRALNPALAAATGDKFVAPQIRLRGICETLPVIIQKI
jgi:hypothetical protein